MNTLTCFIAIKLDLVGSRRLPNRGQTQEKLIAGVAQVNRMFTSSIAAEFIVTHGDEIQGLLFPTAYKASFAIVEYFIDFLLPIDVRFGIGYGALSTKLQEQAIGMDGPVWYNAQRAMVNAKKKRNTIELIGFGKPWDEIATALGNLLCRLRTGWTAQQRRVVNLQEDYSTQSEVAQILGISDAAVSKHLSAAGWRHYEEGREALLLLLAQSISGKSGGIHTPPDD